MSSLPHLSFAMSSDNAMPTSCPTVHSAEALGTQRGNTDLHGSSILRSPTAYAGMRPSHSTSSAGDALPEDYEMGGGGSAGVPTTTVGLEQRGHTGSPPVPIHTAGRDGVPGPHGGFVTRPTPQATDGGRPASTASETTSRGKRPLGPDRAQGTDIGQHGGMSGT